MSEPTVYAKRPPFPKPQTYIGYCCREWVMPIGYPSGRCGLCGERPTFLREDTDPAVERCTGCNLTRVYCQATSDMERRRCCDACSH